ncbi:MAG: bifunctional 4-hydroxy-2-oxoglutarate aldolase/2-dehydro-3-deoxy-phosphogluconate aldolase [Puniceicoccaceae bacterium]
MNLDKFPVIPVIVLEDANDAVPLAEALLEGGLGIIEVTFRTLAAAEAIFNITEAFPEMAVGAGTIITPEQAKTALDAGARFGLAPGTDSEVIRIFKERSSPFVPGVMTPSDIQRALLEGCDRLKFFPAEAAGGIQLLKAMAAPFKSFNLRFCPTGGITLENLADYLALPEVFAVGGTWLAKPGQIKGKEWTEITAQTRQALAKIPSAI